MELHPEPASVDHRGMTFWVHAPTARDYFEVTAYMAGDTQTHGLSDQDRAGRLGMLLAMQCVRIGKERNSDRLFKDLATAEANCPLDLAQKLALAMTNFFREVEDTKK